MLTKEIHPNIFQIKLPVPGKSPGPVNTFLFKGENITLVDTGTPSNARLLRKALEEHSLDFSDIHQIIFTHSHIDHYGAAHVIKKKGGTNAMLFAHLEDAAHIETRSENYSKAYNRFFKLMGVPVFFRLIISSGFALNKLLPLNCKIDVKLEDGDLIKIGDYSGRIIATPGHTKGSICIYLEEENILFSGDHILGHITPNALPMLEKNVDLPIRMSQKEFYDSLSKIESLCPAVIFPAHGKVIKDLKSVLEMYRDCFAKRQKKILSIIESAELNVYQIAKILFSSLDESRFFLDLFLAISEVFTHLQVLEFEKKVVFKRRNNRLYAKIVNFQ